ncbi:hypothetical protein HID58_033419 [Brassica napus]|uniref:Uncharacterized protein n=1 Tax=Brassica napus TaxID=3708 RepID=A0ABQ8BZE4_BRANA|nr:hypothetical protein HID58_033419 [Brassica napus]
MLWNATALSSALTSPLGCALYSLMNVAEIHKSRSVQRLIYLFHMLLFELLQKVLESKRLVIQLKARIMMTTWQVGKVCLMLLNVSLKVLQHIPLYES